MKNTQYYEILTIYECVEKVSPIIGCYIWMICLELNWFVYDPRIECLTFWICMDATFFSMSIFKARLVAIKSANFSL